MASSSLKEKTANGLFYGAVSQGGQQVLNLVFGIFLARLLAPDDYGVIGMLAIFALIATTLQESGFISALNRKEEATPADFNAVFWFNVLCALVVYAVLYACAPLIAAWFRLPVLVPLSRLYFLSFVISAAGTSARAWLFRRMMVRQASMVTLFSLFLSGVAGVSLAWMGFAYWGIAIQNLVYCFFVTAGSWWFARWRPSLHIDLRPLRGMIGFSSRLLATNIFTHVNNNLFSLFFGRLYGERAVGYYNQANKWTGMGYTFLTGMIWNVVQPLFARIPAEALDSKQRMFRKMLRLTAFLSCPALFGLALVAPEFIVITITAKWLPSARLMQLLCVGGAFVPIASLYSNFIISQGRSGVYMWNTIALCLAQLLLLFVLYPYGVQVMVAAYVAANVLWLFVWHHFLQRLIPLRLIDAVRDVLPFAVVAALAMALAQGAVRLLNGGLWLSLAVKVSVGAGVYLLLMRLLGAQIMAECVGFLHDKWRRKG